jgi:hypothetical protein
MYHAYVFQHGDGNPPIVRDIEVSSRQPRKHGQRYVVHAMQKLQECIALISVSKQL